MASSSKGAWSVLSDIGRTLRRRPSFAFSDRRALGLLLGVFVVVFAMLGLVFFLFLSQSATPPASRIAFTAPVMADGNASIEVAEVRGGPYAATTVRASLVVNTFAAAPVALAPSNASVPTLIGPNAYRIIWVDADGDGLVSVGDTFRVTGDVAPLPPLSSCTLRLIDSEGTFLGDVSWVTSSE